LSGRDGRPAGPPLANQPSGRLAGERASGPVGRRLVSSATEDDDNDSNDDNHDNNTAATAAFVAGRNFH
jgi:hypothetical protein